MDVHYEDRHRELREAAEGLPPGEAFEHECLKLNVFDMQAGSLVDDLVAAVRKRSECDACERTIRLDAELSADFKMVGCGCDDAVEAARTALDEAARG